MKKFRYRFEKVLTFRQHQEKQKQVELAGVLSAEQKQLRHIDSIHWDREHQKKAEVKLLIGKLDPSKLNIFSRYYIKLKQMEMVGTAMLKEVRKEVDKKRQVLLEAAKQRKIYEKLKENQLDKYMAEMNRRIQMENDDIGQNIYLQNK